MSDEERDRAEAEEAEALAQALERGHAREALPEDALETAALLRYSRDAGEMPKAREDAVLDELLAGVKPRPQEKRSPLRFLYWLVPVSGLAAAALLLFVRLSGDAAPDGATAATTLPAPSAALVRTQLAVASHDAELSELSEGMRGYRGEVIAALDARYGAR